MGAPRRAQEPVVGLHVVAQADEATTHPLVAQERAVLGAADRVRAATPVASVPLRFAGMALPAGLGAHSHGELVLHLVSQRLVELAGPEAPRPEVVSNETEHVVHEVENLDGGC